MSYYKLFKLKRDPFSTSPNPDFFYFTPQYKKCYDILEINLRLQRGLSVVFGDVGLGKTTLARKLLRSLSADRNIEYHMIIDPDYATQYQFVSELLDIFKIPKYGYRSTQTYKNIFENYIFDKAVKENKLLILIIDEGQKMLEKNLELLRIFLNYETNEVKLLQVIIFAQLELLAKMKKKANLWDRVSYKTKLSPLTYQETKNLIYYRLAKAGNMNNKLFDDDAIKIIYNHSKGYPRKIVRLSYDSMIEALLNKQAYIDEKIVNKVLLNNKEFVDG